MKVIVVYLRLYADCMSKALEGVGKNVWTLLLPMALLGAFVVSMQLIAPLGALLAGFIVFFVESALIGCYLYFLRELVNRSKVSLQELRQSFTAYFWSVMNLLFVLWIVELVLSFMVGHQPNAATLTFLVFLAEFILLNAFPEVIYVRGTYGGLQTIQSCIHFIQQSWIEWFIPNLAFGAFFYFAYAQSLRYGNLGLLVFALAGGAVLHILMVFRGHLFEALDSSSHRQRMFKYRKAV